MVVPFTSLPQLSCTPSSHLSRPLPALCPFLFIPLLGDQPQNPIVDVFEVLSPPEPDFNCQGVGFQNEMDSIEGAEREPWTVESMSNAEPGTHKNQLLSWERLRNPFLTQPVSTPFLSEQSNNAFDAVRHLVQPRLHDPSLELRYLLPAELLVQLTMNMVGNSSSLFVWDVEEERFVSHVVGKGAGGSIIKGLDDVASNSITQRFLRIGTLIRRLETMIFSFQRRGSNATLCAFAHAISTILAYIHSGLAHRHSHTAAHLPSRWLCFADAESLLSALAELCGRKENDIPPYQPPLESPAAILSNIYKHLQRHIEHRSPRHITASIAYVLTASSSIYLTRIGESLGIHKRSRLPSSFMIMPANESWLHGHDMTQLQDVQLDQSIFPPLTEDLNEDDFPDFFPPELADGIPAARRSLRILRTVEPDHPLCSMPSVATCQWIWSVEEVERLWAGKKARETRADVPEVVHYTPAVADQITLNGHKREIDHIPLFDLEPGSHLTKPTIPTGSLPFLEYFLSTFPERLPTLTPTLQRLTTVTLQPFSQRTTLLSRSLLRMYLTSLHFETHLTLLRSYMLLTCPSFKSRLVEALFSDEHGHLQVSQEKTMSSQTKLRIQDVRGATGPTSVLGIGLSHSLTDRDTWPPSGAELGLVLRTVITDSPAGRSSGANNENAENVWKNAESRMGFAIRDFPFGDSRERWLNPGSIEALDFLYLHYKPPYPLGVVITNDVLSKYQRIFTFLLRLCRAETVTRITFLNLFKSGGPTSRNTLEARGTLFRLRFQIQTFVASLIAHVFDSSIHANFNVYIRRITMLREDILSETHAGDGQDITDVFTLQMSHAILLDQILSGCLLRTHQKPAGDVLGDILELVLQFGILLLKIQQPELTEDYVTEKLRELDIQFQKSMLLFVQIICMNEQVSSTGTKMAGCLDFMHLDHGGQRESSSPLGGLLSRIDPTGWWRQKLKTTKNTL